MMMVGPMKRKVMITAIIAFIIPVILLGTIGVIIIGSYTNKITELKEQGESVKRYVFTKDLTANHVITKEDLALAEVKAAGAPENSYYTGTADLSEAIFVKDINELVGKILRVNVKAKTIANEGLFFDDDLVPTIDERLQEFNMVVLPLDLVVNDYIDIRLLFPNGEDYSVIVGKRIEYASNNTIRVKLSEEEIIRMGCAIIESYIIDGAKLYANKYVDPSMQLYKYSNINYIAKYNDAISIITTALKETKEDELRLNNPDMEQAELNSLISNIKITESEIDMREIANMIGLPLSETEEIKNAIKENKNDLIAKYENIEIKTRISIVATYPVKPNVAAIIHANPNILEEIRAKYNVAELEAQRINMLDSDVTDMFGMPNDNSNKVLDDLQKEIEIQRAERQAYLQSLINNGSTR